MERAEVNGVEVAYRHSGEGPPLVLLHGAGDDGRIWGAQVDALADEFTVIAWDEPGAGGSSDVPPHFTLSDYADCLAALIGTLDLGSAHVCGLSWGGTIALETYRRHPGRFASLALADTYAGWKGSLRPAELNARVDGLRRMLEAPPSGPRLPVAGLFAGEPPAHAARLLEEIAAGARRDSLAVALGEMAQADLSGVLPEIAVPTLLIWGEGDVRSTLRVARQFEDAIPGAELVVIPECGHMSNLERPEEFSAALRAFLRRQA